MLAVIVLVVVLVFLGVLWSIRPPRLGSVRADPIDPERAPDAGPDEVGTAERAPWERRARRGILGGSQPGATGGWLLGGGGDGGGADGGDGGD